jgi:hypothetical protein
MSILKAWRLPLSNKPGELEGSIRDLVSSRAAALLGSNPPHEATDAIDYRDI